MASIPQNEGCYNRRMKTFGFRPETDVYILDRLAKGDALDDITMEVCKRTNISWNVAEAHVRQIQESDDDVIVKRQFPLLTGVALFFFIAGLILTIYGVIVIVSGMVEETPRDLTSYIMPVIEQGVDPADALQPAVFPYTKLIFTFIFSPFSAIFFGIAMLLGSLLGMRKIWAVLLNRQP
jgi:hypothetical protein